MTSALSADPNLPDELARERSDVTLEASGDLKPVAGRDITAQASNSHVAVAPVLIPTLRRRRAGPRPATPPARRRSAPRKAIAAVCAITLVCLALAGRERIVTRIPASDRIFAAIGLPVNLAGVEFRNVASKVTEIDGQKVLAVTGEVVNLRPSHSTPVSGLTLTARSADGRALYVWTTAAATSRLGPGEATTFRSRLASPPEDAREVMVALADPSKLLAQAEPAKPRESKGKLASK